MIEHRPVPGAVAPDAVEGGGPAGVVALTDAAATDDTEAGAKAANLAAAATAGLPVLPGFVLTTRGSPAAGELRGRWGSLSDGGRRAVVVRSSSTVEDSLSSSMAGQFRSVLGVRGWDGFVTAVQEVLDSAALRPAPDAGPAPAPSPMAVLVQQEVAPSVSGVLFGLDPVTGDRRHFVADAVAGSPQPLVSGAVGGERYVLSHTGRVVSTTDRSRSLLNRRRCRSLARLARQVARVFGGPQDVEWAFDSDGRLWLLQTRPVTVAGRHGRARGRLFGPGPVRETFPGPLRPLEAELWAYPLRAGIVDALRTLGSASEHRLAASPVLAVIGGWVAVDLDLLGMAPTNHPILRALDPRGPAHRLRAAWRVGKLRAALPELAGEAVRRVDDHLRAVPPLRELSDVQLVGLLRNATSELVALHAHEVVVGMLVPTADDGGGSPTAASVALSVLASGRDEGRADAAIVADEPVVLALSPPRLGPLALLPPTVAGAHGPGRVQDLAPREALRLRARWVQELTCRAGHELGIRLAAAGRLPDSEALAHLSLDEATAVVAGGAVPPDLGDRTTAHPSPPLPATFRLTKEGEVVAVVDRHAAQGGRAAGGGRGVGRVRHWDSGPLEPGDVLIVETLAPELAAVLPGLEGIVAETGSPLSHLAILAREFGVPTVVSLADARRRFPVGQMVVVDGDTGEVSAVPGPDELGP